MNGDWREFDEQEWENIRAFAVDLLQQREAIGRRDYGSGLLGGQFRGDPIQHLEDEIADALAYAYFIRKQRAELESTIAAYEAKFGKL